MAKSDYKPTALWHRKHCIGEFWVRCGSWPRAAVGSYLLLLDTMFQQGPMSRAEVDAILAPNTDVERTLVLARFVDVGGYITHPRADRERNEALAISQKRSKSGRRGGVAPKTARKSLKKQVVETGSKLEAIAKQLPSKSTDTSTPTSVLTSASFLPSETKTIRKAVVLGGRESDRVRWNFTDERWEGLTDEVLAELQANYEALVVAEEMARLADWCIQNPRKIRGKLSNDAFIRSCLSGKNAQRRETLAGSPRVSTRIETTDERRARKDAEFKKNLDIAMARIGVAGNPPPRASSGLNGVAVHPSQGTQQKAS